MLLRAESFVVGVDGGTSKTIALVADSAGRILSAARGAGSNWRGKDVQVAMSVVAGVVREAMARADVRPEEVQIAMFGLSGADWPEDHVRRHDYLAGSNVGKRVIVRNDTFIGLRAGTRRPYGVVVIAGTGCNAAVITPDGREWAFGYYASQGGANTICQDAVWAVLRAEDGRGRPTALTELVLQKLNYACPDDLLRALTLEELERQHVLTLCPLVFEAAYAGDAVAAEIIARNGHVLAEYATTIIRRFELQALEFDLVLSGSVFKGKGPLLIDTITRDVHEYAPRATVARVQLEPALGAVLLGFDAMGWLAADETYANLAQTAPGTDFFATLDGGQYRPTLQKSSHG